MKAIILAAGRGVRMGALTQNTPKPLLKVNGKTLLAHNLDALSGLVDEAIIVVGHLKEQITALLGTQYEGLPLRYVVQETPLGTGHALQMVGAQAPEVLLGKCVLMMGDDLYARADIEACARYDNAILGQRVRDPSRFGVFVLEGNRITDIFEKPETFVSDVANTGLYVFSGIPLVDTPRSTRGEIEFTDVVKRVVRERAVHCVRATRWIPVGCPEDLERAREMAPTFKST